MGRLVLLVSLVAAHLLLPHPDYLLADGHYLLRASTYSFFHAGWLHLAINCLAVYGSYAPRRLSSPWFDLLIPYLIAVAVYPLALRPAIGFSNILYALIGLRTPPLSSRWWRSTPVVVFLAVSLSLLALPQLSATTHLAAFALGVGVAYLRRRR